MFIRNEKISGDQRREEARSRTITRAGATMVEVSRRRNLHKHKPIDETPPVNACKLDPQRCRSTPNRREQRRCYPGSADSMKFLMASTNPAF